MPRKIIKPTKEQLLYFLDIEKFNIKQIADVLGYKDVSNVYSYLRKYNIEVDFSPNYNLRKVDFTDTQKSFVVGTLLGDGYLRTNRECGVNLALTHSEKQFEYLEWKKNILSNFITSNVPYKRNCHITECDTITLSYSTITHPYLKSIKDLLYINGIKTISLDYLSLLNEFSLAVWFCDDGSLNTKYGFMVLCTQSFTYQEHLLLQQWFIDKFKLYPVIEKRLSTARRKQQFLLRFNTKCAISLREIISPFIPQSMKYKVTFNKL